MTSSASIPRILLSSLRRSRHRSDLLSPSYFPSCSRATLSACFSSTSSSPSTVSSSSWGERDNSGDVFDEPIPPGHTLESVRPPKLWAEPGAGKFLDIKIIEYK